MKFIHEKERIYAVDENGKLLAEVTFPTNEDIAEINHTFVDDSLRGQGIAGKLLAEAAEHLRSSGLKVKPTCSYAVSWFAKHPENSDLLK